MKKSVASRSIAGLLSAVALTGVMLVAGPAANAADGTCTTTKVYYGNSMRVILPATASGSINCLLVQGNQGAAVTALQRALNDCNGGNLTVDGVFGLATKNALKAAQRYNGVTADGQYGPQTRNAISWKNTPPAGTWCNSPFT